MKNHLITSKAKFSPAFSLVELLVVIAVIAIIAAIAIPNIAGVREAAQGAQQAQDSNNIVRLASQAYAAGLTNLGTVDTNFVGWSNALTAGTNVTIPGTTNVITFRLD